MRNYSSFHLGKPIQELVLVMFFNPNICLGKFLENHLENSSQQVILVAITGSCQVEEVGRPVLRKGNNS
jgi:hypothetical protein